MSSNKSQNDDSLGKLFHGFLEYYANDYVFAYNTISVRTGGILRTDQCRYRNAASGAPLNIPNMWRCFICVEEPLIYTNTASCVFNAEAFERIKKVFKESLHCLNDEGDLRLIMSIEKK